MNAGSIGDGPCRTETHGYLKVPPQLTSITEFNEKDFQFLTENKSWPRERKRETERERKKGEKKEHLNIAKRASVWELRWNPNENGTGALQMMEKSISRTFLFYPTSMYRGLTVWA